MLCSNIVNETLHLLGFPDLCSHSEKRSENTDTTVNRMVNSKMGIKVHENDIVCSHRRGKSGEGKHRDIVKWICHGVKMEPIYVPGRNSVELASTSIKI